MRDWERFLDAMHGGRYFEAHDCLEPRWQGGSSPRVQAAIWLAVLLLHQARANAVGVERVQRKLLGRLRGLGAPPPLWAAAAGTPVDGPAVCRALEQARDWVLSDATVASNGDDGQA